MKNLYSAPEAEILVIRLTDDVCGPSQGDLTDPGVGDLDGDEI